jgi:hypothetical protein
MGTRSLVRFIRRHSRKNGDTKSTVVAAIYQQYDGYPRNGVGEALAEFLKSRKLCNGIPMLESPSPAKVWANTLGCLAAQYVAQFKKGARGLYVYSPTAENEEWSYEVVADDTIDSPEILHIEAFSGQKSKFKGNLEEFLKWTREYDQAD